MRKSALIACVFLMFVLGSCSRRTSNADSESGELGAGMKALTVGSKIDTEGSLLAQIIIQVLRREGFAVTDRSGTGPTSVVRKALLEGEIDLYPEYTGNGAYFFNEPDLPVWKNAEQAWNRVAERDLAENGLVWLKPAPANNTWAIAVPAKLAAEHGLSSLTDFAAWVNGGGKVRLIGSEEFVTSPAALPAFSKAYGFTLRSDQLVVISSGDTAQTERAAARGTDGVNAAMAYGTDGAIAALDLVVLADPKGVQPVYQPAVLVRKELLDAFPGIKQPLEEAFAKLDLGTLQRLNGRIAVDGINAPKVASEWLESIR